VDKAEQELPHKGDQVRPVLYRRLELYPDGNALFFGRRHDLFRFREAEPVADGENRTVQHRDQQIPLGLVFSAKSGDQGQGDDIDDVDGDHGAHGAGGIDLSALLNILGQRPAQGAIGDVNAGVTQYQQAVGDVHIHRFGRIPQQDTYYMKILSGKRTKAVLEKIHLTFPLPPCSLRINKFAGGASWRILPGQPLRKHS
jgi:hypothetical protein